MKKENKIKNDLYLILILLIVILISFFSLFVYKKCSEKGKVVITYNNKEYGVYDLDNDQEIIIDINGNRNKVLIQDGKVSVADANCRDLICKNHYAIDDVSESIICLPHKLIITIEKKKNTKKEELDVK